MIAIPKYREYLELRFSKGISVKVNVIFKELLIVPLARASSGGEPR
jgi:hypothetical protein